MGAVTIPETQPLSAHRTAVLMNSTEAAPGPWAGPARSNAAQWSFQRIKHRNVASANGRPSSVLSLHGDNRERRGQPLGFPLEHRNRPDNDGTTYTPHNGRRQGFDNHLGPDSGRVTHGHGEQGSCVVSGVFGMDYDRTSCP